MNINNINKNEIFINVYLYTKIKNKYNVNDSFKLTPLNKGDVNLSNYYFEVDLSKYNIIRVCDKIRIYDSEDNIDLDELPNESVYDSCENVHCIYKFHIDENNEKYEYYKQIFIDNLIYELKNKLKIMGLRNETEINEYIENNPPTIKQNSGLMQLLRYASQDIIHN